MANIVMLDRNAFPSTTALKAISSPHTWSNYANSKPQQVIARLTDAEVVVTSKVHITDEILSACPNLKHIAVAATGYNVIDLDACKKHNVSVSNIPSYASNTVAEHVIATSLTLRREINQYRQLVINDEWQKSEGFCLFDKPVNDLRGATLGIIGLGDIGLATAQLAVNIGMKVVFAARRPIQCDIAQQVDTQQLIESSDIISLHCSLNKDSANLISTNEFQQMQNHAILINTARGGIVDEFALVDAIKNNKIGGAAIDVLVEEPPKDHSPLLSIAERTNVIITPHIAWTSQQALQTAANILVDNVEQFLAGSPCNLVSL